MPNPSYGDDVKARVRILLEQLLAYANDKLDRPERFKITCEWDTLNQVVIVRTTLAVFDELTGFENKEQVREALKALENFLEILEDLRENKRGSSNWHFKLKLWYPKSDKEGNLKKFDEEWQNRREQLPGVQRSEGNQAKPAPTKFHNLPRSGVIKFVGRDEELQKLHKLLQQNQQVAIDSTARRSITSIAGMGGIGKTELALQYAIAHRETYKGGICWLRALEDVGLQIVQLAQIYFDVKPPDNLDLAAQLKYCYQRWGEGEALLVLDNLTNYGEIKPLLPCLSRFKVLITTRSHLGRSIKKLSLNVLEPKAALELLQSFIIVERVNAEESQANKLCEWLGYLPLGLELVGRYLAQKQDLSLAEMLSRLETKRLNHRALTNTDGDMTAPHNSALAAFELSWEELKYEDKKLACLLSLFAFAPIPWDLVKQCLPDEDPEDLEDIRDCVLLKLSLLQDKGEGTYQLHPLLREFFQIKLEELESPNTTYQSGEEYLIRAFNRVMLAIAKQIDEIDSLTLKDITKFASAIPHLAETKNPKLIQYISNDDLIWAFVGNGRFYEDQGLYDQAQSWYEQCLEVVKKQLGEEHLDVATSLNYLALLYKNQGRYAEAEPLFLKALEMRKCLLGEEHPGVAESLNNLANLYNNQGWYEKAEPLFLQALDMRKHLLGEEHPDVAESLNNLANLYKDQGRYEEAEPFYLEALKRLLGEEHPNVAICLNQLANLYSDQRRYEEAEPLYLQALDMKKRLLGEEHPDIAIPLNNLANLYKDQGRYEEAEPLFLKTLDMDKRLLGEKHPDTAIPLNNLASLYADQGRYEEAESLYLQALGIRKCLLGEGHPGTAIHLNNLALLYTNQGRYEEAEPLFLKALEIIRSLGKEHPKVAICLNNLAKLYFNQGRYDEAEPFYLQALEIMKQKFEENNPYTIKVRENLAKLYDVRERGMSNE
ncbi:tetratricopeptide repeat protein [Mastigocoleus sp. MO_188.B34]|uniref:tetratricopeptide repeat protein n=1 Tax=Mastigocoleus sp. MO_188.B34 TaxID=3036635 RepID=UPI00260A6605|nr:tetratricopeptide repeat protein [Mastigocoleus sp. MO_188.B34]MDJ0694828.1 tetratricopeptide repeat protein [Mastigocoleus sp. MO_188.B34]